MIRLLSAALLWLGLLFPVASYAGPDEAAQFIQNIGNQVLGIFESNRSDTAKRQELERLFTETVDTNWIGQFVLGPSWRKLNPKQKQDYLENYRSFLISQYVSNFDEYREGGGFKVTGKRALKPDTSLINMVVTRPGEPEVIINYRVREAGGQFKVTDIIVEGVSLLTTQRSEFASVVSRRGIDGLISQLRERRAKALQQASSN
jgi:phospholipid transport system substrate-binding protein